MQVVTPHDRPIRTGWRGSSTVSAARIVPRLTMRGYRYDLRHFLLWHAANHGSGGGVEGPSEFDLIAYRQAMIAAGNRPTTVKCRLTGAEPHRLAAVTVSRIRTA